MQSEIIEKAKVYVVVDGDGTEYNLGEIIEKQHAAIVAADRFFNEAMPKMNVADSCLDANAITAWNEAEIAVAKAR